MGEMLQDLTKLLKERLTDSSLWAVYGDFLTEAGDIRRSIIALELAGKLEEASVLTREHQHLWLGSLSWQERRFEKGRRSRFFTIEKRLDELPENRLELHWSKGFLKEVVVLHGNGPEYDDQGYSYYPMTTPHFSEILKTLVASEAACFLQWLVLENGEESVELGLLSKLPLSSLKVGHSSFVSVTRFNDVDLNLLPDSLEELNLSGHADFPPPSRCFPKLSFLRLRLLDVTPESLSWLHPRQLPALMSLSLEFCQEDPYDDEDPAFNEFVYAHSTHAQTLARQALLPLLSQDFSNLLELSICNIGEGMPLLQTLLESSILLQLTHLSILGSRLEDDAAQFLLSHLDAFQHLQLQLDMSRFSARWKTALLKQAWIAEAEEPSWL
jgi:hypothetical protein